MTNGPSPENRLQNVEKLVAALYDAQEKTQAELHTLAASQVFLTEAQTKTEKSLKDLTVKVAEVSDKLAEVTDKLAEVTDKLDGLIDVVHRHVREPHPNQ